MGRTDIEDALKRLDNLIWDEVRMAIAQTFKATIEHKEGTQLPSSYNTDEIAKNMYEIKCSWPASSITGIVNT